MGDDGTYVLEELAAAFGLTARTARHYIENVLPPRHKMGRGKRSRYGRDTWNCLAFIRKARQQGLTLAQIAGLLGQWSQPQIDRVARGLEDLAIVPAPPEEPTECYSSPCMAADFSEPPPGTRQPLEPVARWQVLYSDDELQIAHKGMASPAQREQVRMAAAYIRRIFEQVG